MQMKPFNLLRFELTRAGERENERWREKETWTATATRRSFLVNTKKTADSTTHQQGFYVFIRAVQTLTQHNKGGVIVVGLAGPSGSGKTVFSHKVQSLIPGCALLSMDDYNDASRLVDGNFDDPRLTDYDTLLANVADLKSGETTRAPIYDFKQSRRVGFHEVAVPESRIVIIEGIYALSSRIRPLLDLRVSVTGGVHFDLVKRVLRDITRSGQAPEAIIQQISDTVYPMYKAYIEPDLKSAHLRIYNTFNPFTGFMDATYILKSDVAVTDEKVMTVLVPHASTSGGQQWTAGMGCESGAGTPTTTGGAVAADAASPVTASFSTAQSALGVATPGAVVPAPSTTSASSAAASPPPPPPSTTAVAPPTTSTTASPRGITRDESETYDIYLLPPNEDPETCSSWLRMRNRDGRYSLMFEEWVVDGPFIISPRITFEVGVRVLGGLMALGYEIGTIMRRTSRAFSNGHLTVKFDDIEGMGRTFVQVQGKDRAAVAAAGAALGLEGSYSPRSYIEMVQLEKLTESFRTVTDDLRRRFAVGGEPLFDAEGLGTPPSSGGGSFGNGNAFGFGSRGGGGVGTGGGRGRGRGGGREGQQHNIQEAPSFTRTTGFNPTASAMQKQPQQQQSRPLTLAQSAPTSGSSALLARLQREDAAADGSSDDDRGERGDDSSLCSSCSSDDENGASPHRRHFSAAKAAAKKALVEAEKQEELKRQQREAARRSTGSGGGLGTGTGVAGGGGGSNNSSRSSSDPGSGAAAVVANGASHSHHQEQFQSAALRLATGTPVPHSAGAAAAAAFSAAAAAAAASAHNISNNGNEGRISPLSQRSDGSSDASAAVAAATGGLALDGGLLQRHRNGNRLLGSISGGNCGNDSGGLPSPSPSSYLFPATTDAQAVLADAMARLATAVDSVDRRSAARVAWASGALGAAIGAGLALVLAKAMR